MVDIPATLAAFEECDRRRAAMRTDGIPGGLADRIVLAGQTRRGEIECVAAPVQQQGHTASAAEIVAAGRKARGEAVA